MNMTIIADADIDIKSISWGDEYGIGLNVDRESNANGEKVHVILWTDSEVRKNEHGYFMSAEAALNGVLVMKNPDIEISGDVIKEMLLIQDYREPEKQGFLRASIYNESLYAESGYKEFASQWLSFPTSKEAVQAVLKEIGVDGVKYTNYRIDESQLNINGVVESVLPDGISIDETNYLAVKLQELDEHGIEKFKAAHENSDKYFPDAGSLINTVLNIEKYDLQPASGAKEYGDFLLDTYLDEIHLLIEEAVTDAEKYGVIMSRLDEITQHINTTELGKRTAKLENGSFTEHGYLTKSHDAKDVYKGASDIPVEYRVFSYPKPERPAGLFKIQNTDISDFAYKLHILAGDYTNDLKHNMELLSNSLFNDYIVIMNGYNIRISEADHTYQDHTEINAVFRKFPHDTRAYLFHIENREDGRAHGSVILVDCGALSEDINNNSISFTGITADIKNSISQYLTPEEWANLKHIDYDKIQGWRHHFDPADIEKLTAHREDFFNQRLQEAETITPDKLLGYLNAEYMAQANYSQIGMIRVPQEAARLMLLHEDAPVYRLMPQEPEKLSIISAATNGLNFQNFREFAVKTDDRAGIDKLCKRETDKLTGNPPAQDISKKRNKSEQNL
jgi:hypothetical protein